MSCRKNPYVIGKAFNPYFGRGITSIFFRDKSDILANMVVLKGLVLAWGTIFGIYILSRHYDHLNLERVTYWYLTLTLFFAGIAIGSEDAPTWVLEAGLSFGAVGFLYAIRWQVEKDFNKRKENTQRRSE